MRMVRKQVRKRGLFGWACYLIFIAFNLFMAYAMFRALVVGTALGLAMVVLVWALGAGITGLLAMLTGGWKLVPEEWID